jgi:uncharacterized protein (TIGR02001 family)
MARLKAIAAGAAAALVFAGRAGAEARGPITMTFDVGAATDYAFRGVSQTAGRPNVFAGADLDVGRNGYVGAWASNVDLHDGTRAEFDLYGGLRPTVGPVTLDIGVIHYAYAGQRRGRRNDYTELKLAPSMALGPATLGLAYFHAQDFFGRAGPSNYVEANAVLPIAAAPVSVSGAVGRQQVTGPDDYTTWNLGVSYALGRALGFDLRYWDTDSHSLGKAYGAKIVLGLKASFP